MLRDGSKAPGGELITWSWEAAASWLDNLRRARDWRKIGIDPHLQLVLGLGLCSLYRPSNSTTKALKEVVELLEALDEEQIHEGQAILITIVEGVLVSVGHSSLILNHAKSQIRQACGDMERVRNNPSLLLLARLTGLMSRNEVVEAAKSLFVETSDFLLLDDKATREQCELWFSVTDLGKEAVPGVLCEASSELKEVLPAVMLSACWQYRLDAATRLLRVMTYLGHNNSDIIEGANFISFQQRTEGSFGYLNPLAPGYDQLPEDRDVAIHLPFTVASLWALGEVQARLESSNL